MEVRVENFLEIMKIYKFINLESKMYFDKNIFVKRRMN